MDHTKLQTVLDKCNREMNFLLHQYCHKGYLFNEDVEKDPNNEIMHIWLDEYYGTLFYESLKYHELTIKDYRLNGRNIDTKDNVISLPNREELETYLEWFNKTQMVLFKDGKFDKIKVKEFDIIVNFTVDNIPCEWTVSMKFENNEKYKKGTGDVILRLDSRMDVLISENETVIESFEKA